MASFNRVVIAGNLTRDPVLKKTPSGVSVCELGLAISEHFRTSTSNELVERVCFVDVEVWQKQAESCSKYLTKGRPVLVEGRLQQDRWKNKSGETRSKLRVRADRVVFLGAPRGETAEGEAPKTEGVEAGGAHAGDHVEHGHFSPSDAEGDAGDVENLPF